MGVCSSSASESYAKCPNGCGNYAETKYGNVCRDCYQKQHNQQQLQQKQQPAAAPMGASTAPGPGPGSGPSTAPAMQIACPTCTFLFTAPAIPGVQVRCPQCHTVLQSVSAQPQSQTQQYAQQPSAPYGQQPYAQQPYQQQPYGAPPAYSAPFVFPTSQGGELEKEPMLLLDTTGSMTYPNKEGDHIKRHEIVHEALASLVGSLEEHDSQAAHEEEGGGLRTVTFAGGRAFDLDDINSRNLREKWSQIRWGGGTQIMPGWNLLMEVYNEEFGNKPNKPLLMALIITDGEAEDLQTFIHALENAHNAYVTIALLGYGKEHTTALHSFQQCYQRHPDRVRIIPFEAETDPQKIAKTMLAMIE